MKQIFQAIFINIYTEEPKTKKIICVLREQKEKK